MDSRSAPESYPTTTDHGNAVPGVRSPNLPSAIRSVNLKAQVFPPVRRRQPSTMQVDENRVSTHGIEPHRVTIVVDCPECAAHFKRALERGGHKVRSKDLGGGSVQLVVTKHG